MFANRIDLRSYHTESCRHAHDFAQLVLPLTGSMELEAGHYSGLINDNIGMYIAPNEPHRFAGSQQNLFLVIDITTNNYSHNASPESNTLHLTTTTKKLLQFTHYYLTHNEKDFFADSLINQLLLHFSTNSFTPRLDPSVLKAQQWIDKYFNYPVDLSKVANECYLSISQLQRRFKQLMGCSLAEYWRMKKLYHAKKLLAQKHCSIEAIAFAVGYEHLSAFSRRFTKVFGESPSQWRIKALNSEG